MSLSSLGVMAFDRAIGRRMAMWPPFANRYARRLCQRQFISCDCRSCFTVRRPRIDESLTLLSDFGQTDAICTEVFDDPAREQSVLLKVMTRGPFEQGQQVWIIDTDGSKVGATVENVLKQTVDSEVTLSTVLPA